MLVDVNGEFRGKKTREGKNGKVYIYANCEDSEGTAFSIFCADDSVLIGLNKGDLCTFVCDLVLTGEFSHFNLLGVK